MRHFFGAILAVALLAIAGPSNAQTITRGWSTPSVATSTALAVITPGVTPPASWAATAQPADRGSNGQPGFGEYEVAVWDLPDYQDDSGTVTICVHADSPLSSTDTVTASVNNGAFATLTPVAASPNAPGPAYCGTLNTASMGDVFYETRAIACPLVGKCLVLQGPVRDYTHSVASLYRTANNGGTLFHQTRYVGPGGTDNGTCGTSAGNACLTNGQAIHNLATAGGGDVGGGTICQLANANAAYDGAAGAGTLTSTNRMMKFTTCPGVLPSQVTITSADTSQGVGPDKVEIFGLNWVSSSTSPSFINGFGRKIFVHDMSYVGPGIGHGVDLVSSIGSSYFRDVDISKATDAVGNCSLAVRVKFHDGSSDAFSGCFTVLQPAGDASYVYNIDPTYTPPGSAAFVTGNTHAGGFTIDGISDTSRFTVGGGVLDGPGFSSCFPSGSYAVVSIVPNTSVTLNTAPTCTESGVILQTGDHPDMWQVVNARFDFTAGAGATTGTVTLGTPYVGAPITDPNAYTHVAEFTRVTAYDPNTQTVTFSAPTLLASTGYTVYSGRNNVYLYGMTATTWADMQGLTKDPDLMDMIIDHFTFNNVLPIAGNQEGITNLGGGFKNIKFTNLTWTGPSFWALTGTPNAGVDFLIKDSTCSQLTGTRAGVTYSNAATCQVNH